MSVYLVSRLFDIFLCWSIVTSQIFFCEAGYTDSNLSTALLTRCFDMFVVYSLFVCINRVSVNHHWTKKSSLATQLFNIKNRT